MSVCLSVSRMELSDVSVCLSVSRMELSDVSVSVCVQDGAV